MQHDRQFETLTRALVQDPGQFDLMVALERLWLRSSRTIDDRTLTDWLSDLTDPAASSRSAAKVLTRVGYGAVPGILTAFENGSEVAEDLLRGFGRAGSVAFQEILRNPRRKRAYDAHRLVKDSLTDTQEKLRLSLDLVRTNDRLRRTLAFLMLEECQDQVLQHVTELTTYIDETSPFEVSWLFKLIRPRLSEDVIENSEVFKSFCRTPAMRRTFVEVALTRVSPSIGALPLEVAQVFAEECPVDQWQTSFSGVDQFEEAVLAIEARAPEILERRIKSQKLHSFDLFLQLRRLGEKGRRVLLRLLKVESPWLRDAAVKELGNLPICEETTAALEDALCDESFLVREQAREVLSRLRR